MLRVEENCSKHMFIDLRNDSLYSDSVVGIWLHFDTTLGIWNKQHFLDLFYYRLKKKFLRQL